MKLFVMGAGYTGLPLISTLKKENHVIYASTTNENRVKELAPFAHKIFVLKSDKEQLRDILNQCDGMFILVAPKKDATYTETYLQTAQNIKAVLEHRNKPFYLLYTSSTSVYEGVLSDCVTEEHTPHPISEKGEILFETEKWYLSCANEYTTPCILRLGGIYGPKRELIDRARRLSGMEMHGKGHEPTNHIHVDDVCAAALFCLNQRLSGIYNLVNDDHPSRKMLYNNLCQSIHIPVPIWNSSLDGSTGYKVSNQKIIQAGYNFKYSLQAFE
jgi:nucleoside-diphosphate-sugar epimerase